MRGLVALLLGAVIMLVGLRVLGVDPAEAVEWLVGAVVVVWEFCRPLFARLVAWLGGEH